jgi:hypothetical protein
MESCHGGIMESCHGGLMEFCDGYELLTGKLGLVMEDEWSLVMVAQCSFVTVASRNHATDTNNWLGCSDWPRWLNGILTW